MAVRDKARKPNIIDRDRNIFIGIDTPIRKSQGPAGYFAATTTVLESVKNNIRNLINTNQGERLYHPDLGMNLRKYLFEVITEENILAIQDEISQSFERWLPFVVIENIRVMTVNDENYTTVGDSTNALVFNIDFYIKNDPNNSTSVSVGITSTGELQEPDGTLINDDIGTDENIPT
jgi:phage baseplate assembly protein W